jgi:hypothetical protein
MKAAVFETVRLVLAAIMGSLIGNAYQPYHLGNSSEAQAALPTASYEASTPGRYVVAKEGALLLDTQTGTLYMNNFSTSKWDKFVVLEKEK